jgi:hypothetical protein
MKARTPKHMRERRNQQRAPKQKKNPRKRPWDWKFWSGIVIAVLALILTALGLRAARPEVSLQPPLDPDNVMTTRFVISNQGMLSLEDVNVASFLKNFRDANNNTIGIGSSDYTYAAGELQPGEGKTLPFAPFIKTSTPVVHGDLSLIVSFSPSYLPFWKKTKGFKFSVVQQSDGRSRLEQQPSEGVEDEYQNMRHE